MRQVKYGFFGEDEAQQIFLRTYLRIVQPQYIQFVEDESFAHRFRASNKKQVDTQFAEACQIGFTEYRQDCFFVGRDLDDFDGKAFQQKLIDMRTINARWKENTLLLVPVQCIEHWLWYLKWRIDHPSSTKNESLESQTRPQAKSAVYGSPKVSNKHSSPIVEQLSKTLDIEWLSSRSASFREFHKQVCTFLASITLE